MKKKEYLQIYTAHFSFVNSLEKNQNDLISTDKPSAKHWQRFKIIASCCTLS